MGLILYPLHIHAERILGFWDFGKEEKVPD